MRLVFSLLLLPLKLSQKESYCWINFKSICIFVRIRLCKRNSSHFAREKNANLKQTKEKDISMGQFNFNRWKSYHNASCVIKCIPSLMNNGEQIIIIQ